MAKYGHAARKFGVSARLRYWFDNTMSRGTPAMVGWLGIFSISLVVIVTVGLIAAGYTDPSESGAEAKNPLRILFGTFSSTFGLDVPGGAKWIILGLFFVLALAGIFFVSALVGLLTTGMDRRLEQLRKGRSLVVEKDHTVVLGWSDQVFTVVSELVEANRSRRRSSIAILAEQDKVDMEDALRRRLGDFGTTRIVCRTGSPLDLADLELVNLNASRSIIVLAPQETSAEDADAFVLKTLLAVTRGPSFKDHKHHIVTSVRDGRNRAVARLAGRDAVVIDADDISARLVV